MSAEYHRPPIRVALMGIGRAMLLEHFPIFKAHPSLFNVVSACDELKERRDIIAQDFPDCRMFRQYADMLDDKDIDLVIVSTPTREHLGNAMESLARGFWTLVESPLALTPDDMMRLRGASMKAKNRLLPLQRGVFAPDYLLTRQMMSDERLGEVYEVRIRCEDYIRRDDWQSVKRLGGGASYYAMPDILLQALKLLPGPPVQMWADLKRVSSLGDAEDFVHLNIKTRSLISADIEFNGGVLAPLRSPSFTIRGTRGHFDVLPGQATGTLVVIPPSKVLPRRRCSVRTPAVKDMHEDIPVETMQVSLPRGVQFGITAFWRQVYNTVRTASAYPISIEEEMEAIKLIYLMKKNSQYSM